MHELSTNKVTGRVEMFSGMGLRPWHGLGSIVQGRLSAVEAIVAAGLNWEVEGLPVSVNGRQLPFPSKEDSGDCWQGITRRDTGECLGIMRGRYECIQNSECFDFLDGLVQDGALQYETAGALRGGRQVWMMAKYDGQIKIAGDNTEQWLLAVSSHDGSYSLMVQWVTVRVVCANTLSIALKGAKNQVKIRHSKTWEGKASAAKKVLGLTKDYFTTVQDALAGMNDRLMSKEEMAVFSAALLPSSVPGVVPTRTANIRAEVNRLFERGAGNKGVSRWDALNAVTDYADHVQVLRGDNSTRLESALLGSGAQLKQRAFEMLSSDEVMADLLKRPHVPAASSAVAASGLADFQDLLNK